ncbi:hypothetical protein [uncultured Microbacterium sp.]|uniref:hypothetical protein n=1 Tax=uncultured Microbacterium sp. TaxID=191216 RepID=UPI00262D76F8|nr:hypothetical protein [uncultured Microbacterium sp.]
MSAADARRRDLQRRAFAPGGSLTPEEAEELRMLSQPVPAQAAAPAEGPQAPAGEPQAPAEEPEGGVAEPVEGSTTVSATPEVEGPTRRHPRWLIPVVLLVALVVGLGVGWLVSPRPAHASPPAMNAAQRQVYDDLVADGGFKAGSVSFAGTKHGASVWTAAKSGQECIIMLLDGHRETQCADPKTGTYGNGMIGVQSETGEGDLRSIITAVLLTNISGERSVIVNRINTASYDDGWQAQYSQAELDLVNVLEQDGFTGPELMISGVDGDIPIWTTWGDQFCIAVVDPDSHDVTKSCTDPMVDAVIQIGFRDAAYSARFTENHGIAVSVVRDPSAVSRVSCDSATGQCTSIDDTTGDIG